MTKPRKKKFIVDINGSIEACLNQMEEEGYLPVRRIEKPVFKESKKGPELIGQHIIFEGLLKGEH
ncbi:NETI protein [Scopulibacillus darangshiensis]|uniref:NETI protein n=1 Tax=Scopulibacillus darangshiensis TaxID=442528 RepID=A0A4R2NRW5_9BACL|nr:NETI motif-containing protein [Scopulibacillus darangshiensis]TCP24095.1 NETI protein [Scopulibacillus darangshiensis]